MARSDAESRVSRFAVSVAGIFALFVGNVILEAIHAAHWRVVTGCAAVAMGLLTYEWLILYSRSLSRQRRAFFDEANVLATYQPRARTHGHLFVPDPPTPGPNGGAPDTASHEASDPAVAAFNANRDSHYSNMFQEAMRLNKEMEARMAAIAEKGCCTPIESNEPLKPVTFDSAGHVIKSPGSSAPSSETGVSVTPSAAESPNTTAPASNATSAASSSATTTPAELSSSSSAPSKDGTTKDNDTMPI